MTIGLASTSRRAALSITSRGLAGIRYRLSRRARAFRDVRDNPLRSLNACERRVFSQNGEDGIIEEIFRRIGTTDRYIVEFGVEDGLECNTAKLLRRENWRGLLIEGNPKKFIALQRAYRRFNNASTVEAFVDAETIAPLLTRHLVPEEFDLLSIDIDGNDYWVWRAMHAFRPRLVVIEYNALYPPPFRWIMRYDATHEWDGTTHHGASLAALDALATERGYALVATDTHGANAFFVREDLLGRDLQRRTPEDVYHPPHYGVLYRHHPYRAGAFVSDDDTSRQ